MNTTQQPVAITTGAFSGIDLGVTQALLKLGWCVVATSRTISKSKELKPSPDLVLVHGNVSKKETAVVNTPMHANDNHAARAKFHPVARMGEVSDIVDPVLYLQTATFVTGENIRVDGGVHVGR